MGAKSGSDVGMRSLQLRNQRGRPPSRTYDILVPFFLMRIKISLFQHFQKEVAEIRRETKFSGVGGFRVPMNPSPGQLKLRDGTLVTNQSIN